jgi:stalled ribosome rescue protein Dom34
MKRKRGYKRGYPVAVLVGFEENRAVLWQIFSNIAKPFTTVELSERRKDKEALYAFHESIVDSLRPLLKEGIRSVVLAAPMRTDYSRGFRDHVRKHHAWLVQGKGSNMIVFGELIGSAGTLHEVAELVKAQDFHRLVGEITSGEAERIVDMLEKRLNDIDSGAAILFSLKEIEDLIYGQWKGDVLKPEYMMLTDKYLVGSKERNRVNRLLQISKNRNVGTRIIDAETVAGKRLSQFGGLVCFTKSVERGA